MQYSPKLKMAMEEIKAVLKKHDIAGMAVIHTPGWSEWFINIQPTYSCAKLEGDHFHVRIKASHYNDDKKLRDQFVTDTTNMMHHLSKISGTLAMQLLEASQSLDKAVNADHFGGGSSSHTQQNN